MTVSVNFRKLCNIVNNEVFKKDCVQQISSKSKCH